MTVESEAPVVLVNITDKAAEKAKALLEARELPEGALRVFVAGGGCSGYQYGMALARSAEDDDIVLVQQGVRILIDP
ncbi:MAG: HesB/IscA family protein [Tepidiformaceae bacterium]